jgi:hypothetical protein
MNGIAAGTAAHYLGSPRRPHHAEGCFTQSRNRQHGELGETSQCPRQADTGPAILYRTLPLQEHPAIYHAPCLWCIRKLYKSAYSVETETAQSQALPVVPSNWAARLLNLDHARPHLARDEIQLEPI